MYAICFLQGMVFYSAVATLYRQQAGVSMAQMALIESVSLALTLLLEIPWGMLADRIGYRRTLVLCNALYAGSKFIFWQADGFSMFLLERVLLGVIFAGISGVDASILVLSCPEEKHQRVFGVYNALGNGGVLLSGLAFTLFMAEDYRLSAFCTFIAYVLAALLTSFLREVKAPVRSPRPAFSGLMDALRSLRASPGLLLLVISGALFGECAHYASVFLSQLQYLRAGLSGSAIGACFLFVTVFSVMGPLSAPVTQLLGKKRTGLMLMFSSALCCALLAVTRNALLTLLLFALLELLTALYNPLHSAAENALVTTDDRATALSVNSLLASGAGVGVNLLMGPLADAGVAGALGACALLCGLSGIVFAFVRFR